MTTLLPDILPKTRKESIAFYRERLEAAEEKGTEFLESTERWLARNDLFFFMVYILGRKDINNDWLFDRCREVQDEPNGYLDVWARDHRKSSLLTIGLSLQDIINDPETTICIFSHTRPIAKSFLRVIKRELEGNEHLKRLFPDILWGNPDRESPKWSVDDGIIVKRNHNYNEATVEAWGLVDGQPTGKHFKTLVYDDVVTDKSVTTPEMIDKTVDAWALSLNLGTKGGVRRIIGTYYHFNDAYHQMLERGAAKLRRYPATVDGTEDGEPVLLTKEDLAEKRRNMGPFIYSCLPGDAPILMADWTERPISEICIGDMVVGWTMHLQERSRLVPSRVLNVARLDAQELIKADFTSGRTVKCTPDHKWYTGRRGTDWHKSYGCLGHRYHDISQLVSVVNNVPECPDIEAAAYLSGIFDGEGSCSANGLCIAQSNLHNPAVCKKIELTMDLLGFDFAICNPKSRPRHNQYTLRGGMQEKVKFLRWCRPAKGERIIRSLFRYSKNILGKTHKDKLVRLEKIHKKTPVFNIETETGNYVAYGYASKNCQVLLDPTALQREGFKKEWLEYWPAQKTTGLNIYMLVDPATSKKQNADYTSIFIIGLGEDDIYRIITMVRDRLNLPERSDIIFELHRRYRPLIVGYEKYGKDSDIEHLKDIMKRENYKFRIEECGGKMAKPERIKRLIPLFEQGRLLLPENCWRTNCEGVHEDLTNIFVNQEYLPYPVSHHDDMLDALSRIFDIKTRRPEKRRVAQGPTHTNTSMRRLHR